MGTSKKTTGFWRTVIIGRSLDEMGAVQAPASAGSSSGGMAWPG
jgi:hypothetical protein